MADDTTGKGSPLPSKDCIAKKIIEIVKNIDVCQSTDLCRQQEDRWVFADAGNVEICSSMNCGKQKGGVFYWRECGPSASYLPTYLGPKLQDSLREYPQVNWCFSQRIQQNGRTKPVNSEKGYDIAADTDKRGMCCNGFPSISVHTKLLLALESESSSDDKALCRDLDKIIQSSAELKVFIYPRDERRPCPKLLHDWLIKQKESLRGRLLICASAYIRDGTIQTKPESYQERDRIAWCFHGVGVDSADTPECGVSNEACTGR